MEFGRLPEMELDKINFSLPKEPPFNTNILPGKKTQQPKVYVGCAKWGRKEWVGKIYPKGTSEKDFLKLYVNHFNSIELNATGYKTPSPEQVKTWAEKVSEKDFLFCPKLVRFIVPNGNLSGQQESIKQFLESINGFGKNLGPVFLMLQENFSPIKLKLLLEFLNDFPKTNQLFIELRHPDWFSDTKSLKELITELAVQNVGLIITDTAGRRDVAHMNLTVPKTFIRFVGNSLHPTDYTRCDDWVKRIELWLSQGLEELYFFMHMHDEAKSPELSVYLIEQLNKVCNLNLHNPDWRKNELF
ncbi:MAG: DUF72 domain-containing protein [Ginsengibacter sp.]